MKHICVIGAGASGIIAAKLCQDEQFKVTVFEKNSELGGVWVFRNSDGQSPMYDNLRTNLPHQTMKFSDFDYPHSSSSFLHRKDVQEYLNKYAEHHNISVRFNTAVENVERVNDKWSVRVFTNEMRVTHLFDAVFVCNGHFSQPFLPVHTSNFSGKTMHSVDYRKSDDFKNKNVAIIGAGPSGIDSAVQVAEQAKTVHLVGKYATFQNLPENVKQYPSSLDSVVESSILLDNGATITDVENIIFCTGYKYQVPFFSADIVTVKESGFLVSPLWFHIAHVHYPTSLFFIGLPTVALAMPLFEVQVQFAISFLMGKCKPPSTQEILTYETNRLSILREFGENPSAYHVLADEQWDYMRELALIGNFEIKQSLKTLEKLWNIVFSSNGGQGAYHLHPTTFKDFKIDVDTTSNAVTIANM